MGDKRLAEIEAREQAATKGPWTVWDRVELGFEVGGPPGGIRGTYERPEDAVFVAHAREDIPWLIAEVRRLRAEIDDEQRELEFQRELHNLSPDVAFADLARWLMEARAERDEAVAVAAKCREALEAYDPPMPPKLPGETDEQYTNRLTGADGTGRRPYKERRLRQCSIGWHRECSDLAGEVCECPCHQFERLREQALSADPGPALAEYQALRKVAVMREALDGFKAWWDVIYPADVFTGESGDEGAVEVTRLRGILAQALSTSHGPALAEAEGQFPSGSKAREMIRKMESRFYRELCENVKAEVESEYQALWKVAEVARGIRADCDLGSKAWGELCSALDELDAVEEVPPCSG